MAARDKFTVPLRCSNCGREGTARLSQEDGWSWMKGNRGTSIEEMPDGFEAVTGSSPFADDMDINCATCGISATNKARVK